MGVREGGSGGGGRSLLGQSAQLRESCGARPGVLWAKRRTRRRRCRRPTARSPWMSRGGVAITRSRRSRSTRPASRLGSSCIAACMTSPSSWRRRVRGSGCGQPCNQRWVGGARGGGVKSAVRGTLGSLWLRSKAFGRGGEGSGVPEATQVKVPQDPGLLCDALGGTWPSAVERCKECLARGQCRRGICCLSQTAWKAFAGLFPERGLRRNFTSFPVCGPVIQSHPS